MNNIFKTLSHYTKYSNNWWDYIVENYIMPNGQIGEYHYVHTNGSTFVIPHLHSDTFIMVNQYRYLNKKNSTEFPGGGLKKGITFEQNAIEELQEESGYASKKIEYIGEFNPYNGVTDEICKVYYATDLSKSFAKPDESEKIDCIEIKFNEINDKIYKGEIWDGMTLAAWSIFCLKKRKILEL